MENYSLLMGAAAVMKMAVEMAAVSMEKPSGALPRSGGVPEQRLLSPRSWLRDGGGSGRFHVGAGIPGVAPHYIPPPSTFNVLLGSSWTPPSPPRAHQPPATRRPLPAVLDGKCLNCLSEEHRRRDCTKPTRCLRCKGWFHMARDCKRPRPPYQGAGAGQHHRAAPAARGCSEGQSSADTSSASRESTPDLPPPRSLLVAPSPPRDDPPPEERVLELCIIERSPVIDAEVLRLRRAILVSVVGESVSLSVIAALLAEVLQVSISAFSVHAAAPEDCLVLFNRMEDRDLALAHPVIPSMSFELRLKPWTPQSQATSAVMRYMVDLDIEGIPAHAWLRSTASSVLSNSCCIDSIADETILRHDLRRFRLSAWTANPGLIPAARTLAIPDEVPLGAPSPIEERHLLHYDIKVHLRGVARPRLGGPDDGLAGDGGHGPSAARDEPPLGDGPEPRRRANRRRHRRRRGPGAPAADAPLDAVAPAQQALALPGVAAARSCTGRSDRLRRQSQWARATPVTASSRWVPRA
ncbi:hypothetical protein QYE76_045816 [Lolium multiflorum]|uniref:CCHC-type domain-containing protein n=1 Tax=Lolium multiflorum TaxID=4521 RepID=A0AAD8TNQ0_LOLMU|nr:hypothetical protein QYE76_045816 [Lolium multiflorum]